MLSQFQSSYQRVEQSLQRLTDSIAAYNPSPSAAEELLAADEAVNANLEQLIEHQSNHQRILSLRKTAQELDETIKKSIQLLSDTRREILAIPARESAGPTSAAGGGGAGSTAGLRALATAGGDDEQPREINVDELLAYAKFISRTTVPPTFRSSDLPSFTGKAATNGVAGSPAAVGGQQDGTATGATAAAQAQNNGTGAPGTVATKQEDGPPAEQHQQQQQQQSEPQAQIFLDQKLPFEPWPSQAHLQMGVLGDIQRLLESGKDPASVLTAEEQAEVDRKRKEVEEREREALLEAERRRMSLFDTAGGGARRRETAGDVFDPDDL